MSMMSDLRFAHAPVAAFVSIGVFWGTFAALVPQIKTDVGLSDGGFGLAMFVAALGAVLAMWLAPWADDRLGRRAMLVLTLIFAGTFLLPGLAGAGVAFAGAMLFVSMMSGTLDVVMNARIAALEAEAKRPLMNLAHGMFSVGYAVSAVLSGLMREAGASSLTVFAIMVTLVLALCLVIAGDRIISEGEDDETGAVSLPWPVLVPGGLIILIAFLSEQATEGWSALHLERNLGAGAAAGAMGPALLGLTMAIGRLSGQVVAAQFSEAAVIPVAATLSACGAVTAAFAPTIWVAYAGFAALGLGVSVIAPMGFAWVARMVRPKARTRAISRVSVIGYAGFFMGPPMMGTLSEGFGLYASFLAVGCLLAVIPLVLVPILSARTRPA